MDFIDLYLLLLAKLLSSQTCPVLPHYPQNAHDSHLLPTWSSPPPWPSESVQRSMPLRAALQGAPAAPVAHRPTWKKTSAQFQVQLHTSTQGGCTASCHARCKTTQNTKELKAVWSAHAVCTLVALVLEVPGSPTCRFSSSLACNSCKHGCSAVPRSSLAASCSELAEEKADGWPFTLNRWARASWVKVVWLLYAFVIHPAHPWQCQSKAVGVMGKRDESQC